MTKFFRKTQVIISQTLLRKREHQRASTGINSTFRNWIEWEDVQHTQYDWSMGNTVASDHYRSASFFSLLFFLREQHLSLTVSHYKLVIHAYCKVKVTIVFKL